MDYNEIAEEILENYSTTYCQADVERVARVLKEISRQTAQTFLDDALYIIERTQDSETYRGFICKEALQQLATKFGVEIKDNEN